MNKTGQILTFLILFMSIGFLILAILVGGTHQNWKKIAQENRDKVTEAQNILNTYKSKSEEIRKELKAERVARQLQLAQLESQLNAAQKSADEKEKQLRDQLEISQKALDGINQAEKRLKEKDVTVEQLQQKNKQLIDDIAAQRQSVVNLTNQVYKLQGDLEQLNIMRMDLAQELAQREKVMDANGLSKSDLTDHIAPEVEGVVTRTQNSWIAVSLGSDDGIREGHAFEIYRGDRYIGKAEVTRVEPDRAAAKLIPEFLRAPVAEGDHVTTKF